MSDEPIVNTPEPAVVDTSDDGGSGISSLMGLYQEPAEDSAPDPEPGSAPETPAFDPPETPPVVEPAKPDGPNENADAANDLVKAFQQKAGQQEAPADTNPKTPDFGALQKAAFTQWAKAQEPNLTDEQVDAAYRAYSEQAGFDNWLNAQIAAQKPAEQPAVPIDPAELDAALLEGGDAVKKVLDKGITAAVSAFVGRYDEAAKAREAALFQQVLEHTRDQADKIIGIAEATVFSALAAKEMPEIYEHKEIWAQAVQKAMLNAKTPKEAVDNAFAEFKAAHTTFQKMQSAPNRVDVRSPEAKAAPRTNVSTPAQPAPRASEDVNNLGYLAGFMLGHKED